MGQSRNKWKKTTTTPTEGGGENWKRQTFGGKCFCRKSKCSALVHHTHHTRTSHIQRLGSAQSKTRVIRIRLVKWSFAREVFVCRSQEYIISISIVRLNTLGFAILRKLLGRLFVRIIWGTMRSEKAFSIGPRRRRAASGCCNCKWFPPKFRFLLLLLFLNAPARCFPQKNKTKTFGERIVVKERDRETLTRDLCENTLAKA